VNAEIEREVQALDRESTEKKAIYFRKRLGINWFDGTIVPILDRVITLRNLILHEDPNRLVDESDRVLLLVTSMAFCHGCCRGNSIPDSFRAAPKHGGRRSQSIRFASSRSGFGLSSHTVVVAVEASAKTDDSTRLTAYLQQHMAVQCCNERDERIDA
jgi:hypothetical protein